MLRDVMNKFSWNSSVRGSYNEGVPATLRFGGAYSLDGVMIAFDLCKASTWRDSKSSISWSREKIVREFSFAGRFFK